MSEVIYEDSAVKITATIVKIGDVSYAVKNINSVRVCPPKAGCMGYAFAGFLIITGVLNFNDVKGAPAKIAGVTFVILGVVLARWISRKRVLMFDTSSGAVTGLESTNKKYLDTLAEYVTEAISKNK